MAHELQGKRIAILAADGVEQVELASPRAALEQAGAQTELLSLEEGEIQGVQGMQPDQTFPVDKPVAQASVDDNAGLVVPGGVKNPDLLRMDEDAMRFVAEMAAAKKPIAAICHGPWVLVETGIVKGRTITSYPSLRTDVENAGGSWVDEEVHVDQGLVTSRKPGDLEAFNAKAIEEFAEGAHEDMPQPEAAAAS